MAVVKVRDNSIEWLRVCAALGIVWFHAAVAGSYWGYSGLIVFLLLSMMFEAGPNIEKRQSISQLARRLLVPWAFWWVAYGLFNGVRHEPVIDTSHGWVLGILASPSIHLWYLPFIFVALVIFGSVKGMFSTRALAITAALLTAATVWAIPIWRPVSLSAGYPLAQWAHAATPVFMGVLLGCASRERRWWILAIPVGAMLAFACFRPFPSVAPIYLLGAALVTAVVNLPAEIRQRLPSSQALFGSMLGVYLVHPVALAVLRPLTDRMEIAGVLAAFAASAAGVVAAQRVAPYPASLVLGTPLPPEQPKAFWRSKPPASPP